MRTLESHAGIKGYAAEGLGCDVLIRGEKPVLEKLSSSRSSVKESHILECLR